MKEATMKNKLLGFAALGFLLTAFVLAVAPVWADGVDEKIKSLEQELTRLKGEQMELKKEATAAAAALPSFSYRPRSGVTWAAADRSWSITTFLQGQFHMYNHLDGQDRGGLTTGDIFARRFRPGWTLCVMDCLYEWHQTWDIDTGDIGNNQNSGLYMNFSKINPWLPDIFVGDEDSITSYNQVARSSTSSAQVELATDLMTDSAVSNLSRRNIAFGWLDKPLMSLPGTFNFALEYRVGAGITENTVSDTDRKEFAAILGVRPFVRSKVAALQRLRAGIATTINSVDSRSAVLGDRLRIRTDERQGRLVLLDANNIGDGMHHNIQGGVEWGIGPYLIRGEGGYSKYESGQVNATAGTGFSHVRGYYWRIGHELFLFSPKGFLTGGAYQPGTVQVGFGFERAGANCGKAQDCDPGLADFNSLRLLKRELDIWYFWNSFSRIGIFWNWWDADNMPRGTAAATALQQNTDCAKNPNTSRGKECDWHSINIALQVYF
jgi:hypothetical protein